jgi:uncharacterized protein (DUF2141 family)
MLDTLISLAILLSMGTPEKKGTLVIEINGLKEAKGTVQIGIYNKANGFASDRNVYLGKVVDVNSKTVTIKLPNLPYGDYAIAAYHDANANGKLDKNFFGVPTELYGFSNNARGLTSAPDFDDAKFSVNSGTNKVSFALK